MDTEETSGMEAFTEDVAGLWQSYWQTHGIEERNELTEHYLSLVRLVAGRLAISLPPLCRSRRPSFQRFLRTARCR